MSSRMQALKGLKEGTLLNVICVLLGVGFLALAVANFVMAGDFLSIDSLFLTVVCLLLAGAFFINPAVALRARRLEQAATETEVVDTTPVHFEGTNKLFMLVWVSLLVLTGIEVVLGYIHLQIHLMLTILIGLSLIKAALIIAYFMHLRFERLSLVLTLIPMLVICICLLFVFFPDGMRSKNLRYQVNPTTPVAEESK